MTFSLILGEVRPVLAGGGRAGLRRDQRQAGEGGRAGLLYAQVQSWISDGTVLALNISV